MFDISADLCKNTKFYTRIIFWVEIFKKLYFPKVLIAKYNTSKMCKTKDSQTVAPVENSYLKVAVR